MRIVYSLSALIIFVFSTLVGLGNLSAHASVNIVQSRAEENKQSTLLTFSPSLTSYLPIIVKPPPAPSVHIASSSVYTNTYGTLYVVGEVINHTSTNVRFVRITVTLHNSAGAVIRSDYSYALVDVLAPGKKSPFKIYFSDYPQEYTTYRISSVTYSATTQPAMSNVPVLSSSIWNSGYGNLYIAGEVQNNTGRNVEFVKTIVTLYNSVGIVTEVEYSYVMMDVLGPGQKGGFKIYADDRPYNSYSLTVDYNTTTALPPAGVSAINLNEWTSYGTTYFTGEVQNNNSGNIEFIRVVSTFYDSSNTVTDIASTFLEVDMLGSGQKGCFKLYGTDRPYNSYSLAVDFYGTTDPLPSLEVLSVTSSGSLHLAGEIRNNHTSQTYDFVKAVATLYDGTGKVMNCEYDYTSPTNLNPGATAPYDINFYSHTSGWANYLVVASD